MLQAYRNKFLSYNDDIQGTASVVVSAILGGIRLQKPGGATPGPVVVPGGPW